MSNYTFTDLRDRILRAIDGRWLGIIGDTQTPVDPSILALNGTAVGSSRSGPNAIKVLANAINGAGPVTVPGVLIGDHVELVLNLAGSSDSTAAFETIVTVNGQVQQLGTSLAGQACLFFVQPQS